MSYYTNKYSLENAAPHIQRLREHLNKYGKRLVNEDDPDRFEWYFYPAKMPQQQYLELNKYNIYLQAGGFVKVVPTDNGSFIIINPSANGKTPTTSPTHVRLPKLSHLITLTPEDFFTLIRLITTARTTAYGSLQLNFPAAGVTDFSRHPLSPYFTVMRVNYNMNVDYADAKWTPKNALPRIADLEPTRENHLIAMQFLTSLQNSDLLYFPVETMVDLDLEWQQVNDNYCVPQQQP